MKFKSSNMFFHEIIKVLIFLALLITRKTDLNCFDKPGPGNPCKRSIYVMSPLSVNVINPYYFLENKLNKPIWTHLLWNKPLFIDILSCWGKVCATFSFSAAT